MNIEITTELKKLADIFPVPLYAVGGFVRDSVLGYNPKDVDISSSLTPEEVTSLIPQSEFSVKTGSKKLLTLIIKTENAAYEYTAFRADSYTSGHRPSSVTPCKDITVDASRRDFTANAVYYDIKNEKIVDPLNGLDDIKNKILRTTRSPYEVFSEDGLRLMRLARFAASLDFTPSPDALSAAKEHCRLIDEISKERIRDELDKILVCDTTYNVKYAHYNGLKILDEIKVFERILPEITLGKGMAQRSDYHAYDVFEHIMQTVKASSADVRLAALMHDVAKPKMKLSTGLFRGHDREGGIMTRAVLSSLRYPSAVIEETARLVENHMFNLNGDVRKNTMRKFLLHNRDIAEKLVKLKYADYYGSGKATANTLPSADAILTELKEMEEEKVPFTVSELEVSGTDLKNIPFLPEKYRGKALKALLEERVLYGSPLTDKEKQLEFIKNYARRQLWTTE